MNIRTKLTLRFAVIVASILSIFSISVYVLSEDYRREDFFSRLESRGITTARLLVSVQEINTDLLKIIDKNSVYALIQEQVLIFDRNNKLIYNSLEKSEFNVSTDLLDKIRREKQIEFTENDLEIIGIVYNDASDDYAVIASAFDKYGRSKLSNLRNVLLSGFIIGLGIIFLAGLVFAGQVLRPLAKINEDISNITAGNLSQRIDEGNKRDEIARLGINFNKMLERLKSAFDIQQQFVSNASHELRTPLAAIRGQLQTVLDKKRSPEEYRQVLQSLFEDTNALVQLTNGLLTLAQSSIDRQRSYFKPVRVDEVVYAVQQELGKSHPEYHFQINFDNLPEDDRALTVLGNEQMLRTVFLNLMDNACKYSIHPSVIIRFIFPAKSVVIECCDQGIGVLPQELEKIFQPFIRGSNILPEVKGYGIGLSLCERIIHLHRGSVTVESVPLKGSTFRINLPLDNSLSAF